MEYKKVKLNDLVQQNIADDAFVEFYLVEKTNEENNEPRPAMIVIPGGGYSMCSSREGEPIALRYCSEGFNCFVLKYTCNVAYPIPHFELASLFKFIYENADDVNIDRNKISIVGFSAGGHLCASYGFLYKNFASELKCEENVLKPFCIVLGYPVTSTIMGTQSNTKKIITGNNENLILKLSVPENIKEDYPPTYIWTTKADQCVPVEHSLQMVEALKQKGIKFKFDLFENGVHGGSLCNHSVYNSGFNFKEISENRIWIQNSVDFIFNN